MQLETSNLDQLIVSELQSSACLTVLQSQSTVYDPEQ